MCGLAALFFFDNSPIINGNAEILAMRDAMASRGPDGSGIWNTGDERVYLAHRRLSIIDLSKEASQPFLSDDGSCAIVYNGEIYNYKDLRRSLEEKGVRFRTSSDTEVLLQLYLRFGERMLCQLRGMFAFAIWDSRRQGLFLARDHFGIKPLYYSSDGKTFRLASQVKALLAGGNIDRTPCSAGRVSFFLLGYMADPFTAFKNIKAIEAGTYMWVDNTGKMTLSRYFKLNDLYAAAESYPAPAKEIMETMREGLDDSVRAHLVADVDVGLFLSSGKDSACLASHAHHLSESRIRAITLGFDEYQGTSFDEFEDASLIAKKFDLDHTVIIQPKIEDDNLAMLNTFFAAMDQPTVDGINTFLVSRAASSKGLKACLSGLGADELLQGYPLFQQLPLMKKWLYPLKNLPRTGKAIRVATQGIFSIFRHPSYAGLAEYGFSEVSAYPLLRGIFMPWELHKVLPKKVVDEGVEELDIFGRLASSVDGISDSRLIISCLEFSWYVRNQLLRSTDWSSMAHSVEVRVPFVDICLLEKFIPLLATPRGIDKNDMINSVPLPEWIRKKPKLGFNVPVEFWVKKSEKISDSNSGGYRSWAKHVFQQYYPALSK